MASTTDTQGRLAAVAPGYVLDHESPAALFTRLQRVVIHLEALQEESMRDFDITFGDFVILATLRKEPAPHRLPVSRLAQYILRPMGSITQAVDRVERIGLVRRTPDTEDRRKVLIALTDEGRRFADEAFAAYDDTRERVLSLLSGADQKTIDASVTLLLEALEADHWEHNP
jgi:DNA-binding MarR family transcriptional regulator